jgi:RNA polymerase sigma-70 factor (ECF subfamily)
MNGETLRWLDTLNRDGAMTGMSDGRLLERFLSSPGPAGEAAFEVIVRRHGPMVLSLCRGVLRDDHDADDAFQATFLILARRAATVRDHSRLATWLGRVARRTALRARKEAANRRALERRRIDFDVQTTEVPTVSLVAAETAALVRAEVDRLPEPDRILMRLTYWQGKTYEETADETSRPIGTVRSRLARARDRLRERLSRLGLASTAPMVRPSDALILKTAHAASRYAGAARATIAAGTVPATVAALVEGEFTMTMTMTFFWKSIAAAMLVGGATTAGALSLVRQPLEPTPAASAPSPPPPPEKQAEAKSLLANGGIEDADKDAPKGWSKGAEIPGVQYIWSRNAAHDGKASLCLKKTAQRYFPIAQWSQKFDREGDVPRLKVSAWIKAEKAGKAILDAQFIDGEGNSSHAWVAYIGAREADDPPADHDWKRYEGVVAIPPGTRQIVVAPQIYGPGTVWFDDLKAEYTTDPVIDPTRP